ncbi:uncharacterized protein EI90DRAFT_3014008 [Cantharellus anzutake]|uniref:uncharacterized protein n=1 Tax=Cantharellus anzutake TaxID=1750568 RepID=UPI001907348F|nr:uncharacterized protein EI90DRAFT_3014008 [Cantharellus anzutake]KAF8337060.1 hypothetical protein EI90DRAFT_3014008 [Cantharellus anzutake]
MHSTTLAGFPDTTRASSRYLRTNKLYFGYPSYAALHFKPKLIRTFFFTRPITVYSKTSIIITFGSELICERGRNHKGRDYVACWRYAEKLGFSNARHVHDDVRWQQPLSTRPESLSYQIPNGLFIVGDNTVDNLDSNVLPRVTWTCCKATGKPFVEPRYRLSCALQGDEKRGKKNQRSRWHHGVCK